MTGYLAALPDADSMTRFNEIEMTYVNMVFQLQILRIINESRTANTEAGHRFTLKIF
jgi:hypothetical protein